MEISPEIIAQLKESGYSVFGKDEFENFKAAHAAELTPQILEKFKKESVSEFDTFFKEKAKILGLDDKIEIKSPEDIKKHKAVITKAIADLQAKKTEYEKHLNSSDDQKAQAIKELQDRLAQLNGENSSLKELLENKGAEIEQKVIEARKEDLFKGAEEFLRQNIDMSDPKNSFVIKAFILEMREKYDARYEHSLTSNEKVFNIYSKENPNSIMKDVNTQKPMTLNEVFLQELKSLKIIETKQVANSTRSGGMQKNEDMDTLPIQYHHNLSLQTLYSLAYERYPNNLIKQQNFIDRHRSLVKL